MKLTFSVTLLCAFGVLSSVSPASAAAASSLTLVDTILSSLLSGVDSTISGTINQLNCTFDTVATIQNEILDSSNNKTKAAINLIVNNELSTLAGIFNTNVSNIRANCPSIENDTEALINSALSSNPNCSLTATVAVRASLNDAINQGNSLLDSVNGITANAPACLTTTEGTVTDCLKGLVADVPDKVTALSSNALTVGVNAATLPVADLSESCSLQAVAAVLADGDSCSIMSDLGTCLKSQIQ